MLTSLLVDFGSATVFQETPAPGMVWYTGQWVSAETAVFFNIVDIVHQENAVVVFVQQRLTCARMLHADQWDTGVQGARVPAARLQAHS